MPDRSPNVRRREFFRRRRPNGLALLLTFTMAIGELVTSSAAAQEEKQLTKKERVAQQHEVQALIDDLKNSQKADSAVDDLVKVGKPAIDHLLGVAIEGNELIQRGWAIVCLSRIGGAEVDERLAELHQNKRQPKLVQTWAAAARVQQAESIEQLSKVAPLLTEFPALKRPLGLRLVAVMQKQGEPRSLEKLLAIDLQVPQLQPAIAPIVLNRGAKELAAVMVGAKNQQVAKRAAAYLGTLSNQGDQGVAAVVADAYKFDPKAKAVPWRSGALWLPGVNWNLHEEEARRLAGNLVSWFLWCELHDQKPQQSQIANNLQSLNLASAAGFSPSIFGRLNLDQLLQEWGRVVGKSALKALLAEQGVEKIPRYKAILDQAK